MNFKPLSAAFVAVALSLSTGTAQAGLFQIPGLFNTGVSGSGTALAENEVDTHWEIVASPVEAMRSGTTTITGTVSNFYNGPARAGLGRYLDLVHSQQRLVDVDRAGQCDSAAG